MELKEAFDRKALVAELKKQGLPMVEDSAEKVTDRFLAWVKASSLVHENVYVKTLGSQLVGILRPLVMDRIDEIDGKPDPYADALPEMQVAEAFDRKALVEGLKAEGLPLLEDGVEKLADTLLDWIAASAALHENPYFKAIGVPAVGIIRPLIMDRVDQIHEE